ncbi:MAG: hypothetical protein QM714_15310 [Nocardioides sp.]|uniref:hypothetical protein n=1 Tax=Nocardioides sp. TaxID=35761 RepID=UPI0039E50D2B
MALLATPAEAAFKEGNISCGQRVPKVVAVTKGATNVWTPGSNNPVYKGTFSSFKETETLDNAKDGSAWRVEGALGVKAAKTYAVCTNLAWPSG